MHSEPQIQNALSINDIHIGMDSESYVKMTFDHTMQGKSFKQEFVQRYGTDEYYISIYRTWLKGEDNIIKPYLLTWASDKKETQRLVEEEQRNLQELRNRPDYPELRNKIKQMGQSIGKYSEEDLDLLEKTFLLPQSKIKTSTSRLINIKPENVEQLPSGNTSKYPNIRNLSYKHNSAVPTSPLKLNAYGLGVHQNRYGQPVQLRPDFGGVYGEKLEITPNAYGLGVHKDQYGRPVRECPWP
jgi:hypothetical protein